MVPHSHAGTALQSSGVISPKLPRLRVRTAPGAQPEADGQFHSRVSEYFVAVNRDEIPNIVAVDDHLDGDSFEFALDLLVDGLEVRLARTRAAAVAAVKKTPARGRRPAAATRGEAVVRPAHH